jgi:hypothetical protein
MVPSGDTVPSGDQEGCLSSAASVVIRVATLPPGGIFIGIFQMSEFPLLSDWKAIVVPSGDQEGCESSAASVVCWVATANPKRAGLVQMSGFSLLSDWKAILVPSGDQEG